MFLLGLNVRNRRVCLIGNLPTNPNAQWDELDRETKASNGVNGGLQNQRS